jgi:hypothetical protein
VSAALPRDVALLPAVSPDGASAELPTGEILLLPAALWQAIDAAIARAGAIADAGAARTAFAGAFAQALHAAGLILVEAADPKSTQSVGVSTYSLALSGKHAVEAKLAALRMAVMGWECEACSGPLLQELAQGVLALAGRAPPDDRRRLGPAFIRLRALAAILKGTPTAGWDVATAPPLPDELVTLIDGDGR